MERLKKVQFFVEANSFEEMTLWSKYSKMTEWEQDSLGFSHCVGHIKSGGEELPVVVKFTFAKINGKLVCFYDPCSRAVDYTMVEDFLTTNYPVTYDSDTRRAMCDAMNFHQCYHFCQEKQTA